MYFADEYTLDGEFVKQYEVIVKKSEIEVVQKNFKRAYWPWQLPQIFRNQSLVCTFTYISYVHMYIIM